MQNGGSSYTRGIMVRATNRPRLRSDGPVSVCGVCRVPPPRSSFPYRRAYGLFFLLLAGANENREKARQDHGHGHRLGTNTQQRAFANRSLDSLVVRIGSALGQRIFEVDSITTPDLADQGGWK